MAELNIDSNYLQRLVNEELTEKEFKGELYVRIYSDFKFKVYHYNGEKFLDKLPVSFILPTKKSVINRIKDFTFARHGVIIEYIGEVIDDTEIEG